jgi:hypothetical protein
VAAEGSSLRQTFPLQLVTNGTGKVWAVDENGKPLGIYTDNSAIRTQQGFQPIEKSLNYYIRSKNT